SPACRPNQNRVHGVAKFENANISCDVDANPPQVKFRWTFNNSAESNEVQTARYRSSGTRSVVTYTPMSELDYGTLLCWATNKIGDQRVPCVYHVIAAGRPDTVHNCTQTNYTTDSFFLQCSEGFNGGLPQSFVLELYDSQTHKLRVNMTTSVPVFSVTGLEPGLSFQAHVYAFNNKGRSEASVISAYTLLSSPGRPFHARRLDGRKFSWGLINAWDVGTEEQSNVSSRSSTRVVDCFS
ncbi:unnamed protein product, partial [Allacma fusca]